MSNKRPIEMTQIELNDFVQKQIADLGITGWEFSSYHERNGFKLLTVSKGGIGVLVQVDPSGYTDGRLKILKINGDWEDPHGNPHIGSVYQCLREAEKRHNIFQTLIGNS